MYSSPEQLRTAVGRRAPTSHKPARNVLRPRSSGGVAARAEGDLEAGGAVFRDEGPCRPTLVPANPVETKPQPSSVSNPISTIALHDVGLRNDSCSRQNTPNPNLPSLPPPEDWRLLCFWVSIVKGSLVIDLSKPSDPLPERYPRGEQSAMVLDALTTMKHVLEKHDHQVNNPLCY